jgi:hypothetical protein
MEMGFSVLVVAMVAYVIWWKVPDSSSGTYFSGSTKQGNLS